MAIRHVVLFEVLDSASEHAINRLVVTLRSFASIPGVLDVSTGRNFSGRSEFDVAFTCDFSNRATLDSYISHPDHVEIVQNYLPSIVKPGWNVIDFEFENGK